MRITTEIKTTVCDTCGKHQVWPVPDESQESLQVPEWFSYSSDNLRGDGLTLREGVDFCSPKCRSEWINKQVEWLGNAMSDDQRTIVVRKDRNGHAIYSFDKRGGGS